MITQFILTALIVGVVTAALGIKFDRFFTILLLLFLFKLTIFNAVNIFLWVIMFGALMIILDNKKRISELPKKMKLKLFVMIPLFTLVASFVGSYLFSISATQVLLIVLGFLTVLYGLRLIFIHFHSEELDLKKPKQKIAKICGLFGPVISGFFIGFIGTSLKSLKIPFAIKIGKMNAKQVYLGNVITTFFASLFAIVWHFFLTKGMTVNVFYEELLLGAALWTGIHYTSEITNILFNDKWKKPFQILIGIILSLVSIRLLSPLF